jgi:glutamate carboxypeptidase
VERDQQRNGQSAGLRGRRRAGRGFAALPGESSCASRRQSRTLDAAGARSTQANGRHLVLRVRPVQRAVPADGHMDTVYPSSTRSSTAAGSTPTRFNAPGAADMKAG